MGVQLRDATDADAALLARLHADSWRAAYRGIFRDQFLDHEADAERLAHWRERLSSADWRQILIAEDPDPAGFCAAYLDSAGRCDALIDNLHVRPNLRGRGLGPLLLGRMVERLIAAGHRSMFLWVFTDNAPALRFYQSLGCTLEDPAEIEVFGSVTREARCVWRDLPALANACRARVR